MDEMKIYISVFVFALLATVKMTFPGVAEDMREKTLYLLSNDENCIEVIETMGRQLSRKGLVQDLTEVFGLGQQDKKETVKAEENSVIEDKKADDKQVSIISLKPEN